MKANWPIWNDNNIIVLQAHACVCVSVCVKRQGLFYGKIIIFMITADQQQHSKQ